MYGFASETAAPAASTGNGSRSRSSSNSSGKKRRSPLDISRTTTRTPGDRQQTLAMKRKRAQKWRTSKMTTVSMECKDGGGARLENTYRVLSDEEEISFSSAKVLQVIHSTLKEYLGGLDCYHPDACGALTNVIAEEIKSRVKSLGFARYKMVAHVVIGQENRQGLMVTSRCVWNVKTDSYVTVEFQQSDIFAVATLFGTYFE